MKLAFWDASALVPLCVQQQQSLSVRRLLEQYGIVIWWATSVEICSAVQRLLRMGQLTPEEHVFAMARLRKLRRTWSQIEPTEALRSQAEAFLAHYPLKAADALQLSAALTWCSGAVQSTTFISSDAQLLQAAVQVGFHVVMA